MTIKELNKILQDIGVPANRYYLHGLYGSKDDNDKLALTLKKGECNVYFKEYGVKTVDLHFETEDKACEYLFKHIKDDWTFEQIQKIDGLGSMTLNERLYISGLMDEFDKCKNTDKTRAKQILRWLLVDERSIDKIINISD